MAKNEMTEEYVTNRPERDARVREYIATARAILDSGAHVYGTQLVALVHAAHSPDLREIEDAISEVVFSGDYGTGVSVPLRTPPF